MTPEARRAQMIEVAEQLLLEGDVSTFTMDKLAAEAGVTKPLLYRYFAGKDEILAAVLDRAFDGFGLHVEEEIAACGSFRERLGVLAGVTVGLSPQFAVIGKLQLLQAPPGPLQQAQLRNAWAAVQIVARLIQDEYPVRDEDALAIAGAVTGGSVGVRLAASGWLTPRTVAVLTDMGIAMIEAAVEGLERVEEAPGKRPPANRKQSGAPARTARSR